MVKGKAQYAEEKSSKRLDLSRMNRYASRIRNPFFMKS